MLESVQISNLLSFGSEPQKLALSNLNILIGPNGCGKSNLVACLNLLCKSSDDLTKAFDGPILDWLHKPFSRPPVAFIKTTYRSYREGAFRLEHVLSFTAENQFLKISNEKISKLEGDSSSLLFAHNEDTALIYSSEGRMRELAWQSNDRNRSVLSQRRDPELYPEITELSVAYQSMSFYYMQNKPPRGLQRADLPNGILTQQVDNLAMVLMRLRLYSEIEDKLNHYLSEYFGSYRRLLTLVQGGYCEILIEEESLAQIPASRLSDGTLRFITLLAILLNPEPPPLICIEEPEICQHPDSIPLIAELLVDAAQRTQIIVTTHSVELVDTFSEDPEKVIVCEKNDTTTTFDSLDPDSLKAWLENYSLGHLWTSGEIGGNRW